MDQFPRRLRDLSFALRVAVTCLLAMLAGGFLAAAAHMHHHHSQKDDQPGLSMDDLIGSYSGIHQPAPLLVSIKEEDGHGAQYLPEEKERTALLDWLQGDSIQDSFDDIDLGDMAPSEILFRNCLSCHSRQPTDTEGAQGIGETLPLDYLDDVTKVAFSRELDAVPVDILALSTHTHALTMPLILLVSSLLFLATGGSRAWRHGLVMVGALALLTDLACWWLARLSPLFVYVILAAGAVFGTVFLVQTLAVLVELWLRPRRP